MRQIVKRAVRYEGRTRYIRFWMMILTGVLIAGIMPDTSLNFTLLGNRAVPVYAAAGTGQEDSVSQILQKKLLDEIQIDDIQKMLNEIMGDHSFSAGKMLMDILNGDDPVSKESVRNFLYSLFFSEIENEKNLLMKLLLIILIAAVLAEFADVFGNGQAGDISFYIV